MKSNPVKFKRLRIDSPDGYEWIEYKPTSREGWVIRTHMLTEQGKGDENTGLYSKQVGRLKAEKEYKNKVRLGWRPRVKRNPSIDNTFTGSFKLESPAVLGLKGKRFYALKGTRYSYVIEDRGNFGSLFIRDNTENAIIGQAGFSINKTSNLPVMGSTSLNEEYRGQGLAKLAYKALINKYGGIISDSSLSKRRNGGDSFSLWKSLSNYYSAFIIKNTDLIGDNLFSPKPIKNIDRWVGKGKGTHRLVILRSKSNPRRKKPSNITYVTAADMRWASEKLKTAKAEKKKRKEAEDKYLKALQEVFFWKHKRLIPIEQIKRIIQENQNDILNNMAMSRRASFKVVKANPSKILTIPISQLYTNPRKAYETAVDVAEGRLSYEGKKPLIVSRMGRGKYLLMDGHHRALEARLRGEKKIRVEINPHMPTAYQWLDSTDKFIKILEEKNANR